MQVEHKLPELRDGALKILAGLFVAFDLALGTDGVEEASDGVLVSLSIYESRTFA